MGYYKDNKASGGGGRNSSTGRNFGGSRGADRGDRGSRGADREMHKTKCSNCGKECEVPFRPTGAKPVYCNDCFRTMGGNDAPRGDFGGSRDRSDRPRHEDRGTRPSAAPQHLEQFKALNEKLDKILMILGGESIVQEKKEIPKQAMPDTFTPLADNSTEQTLDVDALV
jgi:CxxC-x17-CxxC domain-containing protein